MVPDQHFILPALEEEEKNSFNAAHDGVDCGEVVSRIFDLQMHIGQWLRRWMGIIVFPALFPAQETSRKLYCCSTVRDDVNLTIPAPMISFIAFLGLITECKMGWEEEHDEFMTMDSWSKAKLHLQSIEITIKPTCKCTPVTKYSAEDPCSVLAQRELAWLFALCRTCPSPCMYVGCPISTSTGGIPVVFWTLTPLTMPYTMVDPPPHPVSPHCMETPPRTHHAAGAKASSRYL
ncbi:hypothetical protein QBC35DRAFT_263061 [Podospora australis]|uniref:Uncharacterized protein n=1 Tax=Podospora australis TaxID=1536484 RepID=A0AAN6X1V3_9PEZI|nr:hypothetical protein QBC35DRAFT_263061 [Podospora australis]